MASRKRCYCAVLPHSRSSFAVHFVYTGIIAFSEAGCNYPAQRLATGVPHFCGLNTLVGYGALAEAMARWQAAQVSALITLTPLFTLLFSDLLSMAARCLRQADAQPVGLSRCVCRGCGRDVFRHWSSSLGALAQNEAVVIVPAQANELRRVK